MDNSSCPPPDLAAVLQTLARFAPPPPPLRIPSTESPYHDEDYEPPETVARASDHAHLQVPGSVPSSAISPENSIPPSKRIDPATITDWPSGLRSVMRTVASNETSVARIKRMIQVQHEHERQWWEGRQALIKKHEARVDGRKRLNDVLRAVGGKLPPSTQNDDDDAEDARELGTYDRKVHLASKEMIKAMHGELRDLGIPFFGLRPHLVVVDDNGPSIDSIDDGPIEPSTRSVRATELLALQKKMLELLQDMCTA